MEERDTSAGSQASEQGQKFDVFLSHSGKQKDFIRQLHRDLTNQGVSCFFDQDRESLPLTEDFPRRIFEAINTCQVAVLLLSKDFLKSKWPMLELSAFVEARDIKRTNPNLKILPLFYLISPDALKNTKEKRNEWQRALKAIGSINGLKFGEGEDEVKFREEIVKQIWHVIHSPRYHVRGMQGEARMCQEVSNFFDQVQPKNGVRIVGLYGTTGYGKTTLCKAFCNSKLRAFQGKVCHLEVGKGDPFERVKHALQNLTHSRQLDFQTLTNEDQAKVELVKRIKGKRVLLVLDNITEKSIEEVTFYVAAGLGENSWILLSARSGEVLEKYLQIDKQSCMHVPFLTADEAVKIFLERAFQVKPTINEVEIRSAFNNAKICLVQEVNCDNSLRAPIFHPLALKTVGSYLFSKYGVHMSKWVGEIDAVVDRPGHGVDELLSLVLGKALDDMPGKYRTIFMLLTVYILPNMSLRKVFQWMAINCNENITFIQKALHDLREKAFIEEFEPEIRINYLVMKLAQRKADKMERWLWWKRDLQYDSRGLISEDKDGFELAKLEDCMYETIGADYIRNLFVVQFVNVHDISTIDFDPMKRLRSITLWGCKSLEAVVGMENLRDLAWLQIKGVNPKFKLPDISRIRRLQYIEIDLAGSQVSCQLGDLSNCYRLTEIYFVCPSLIQFPRLESMKHLEKVEFSLCDKVKGPLDCRDCVKLQTIVLSNCWQMAASPLLAGCEKLENLRLWSMRELMDLPSFERLSNLTVLKLGKCGIREPPNLTGCKRLQNVYFFSLRNLKRFPNFSYLSELKKLSLRDCIGVQDPPDLEECHKLEVFHLLYNDNMKGLPKMDKCAQLKEIHVTWRSVDKVAYEGIDPDSRQVNEEIECYLEDGKVRIPRELKEVQCMKGEKFLVKQYFRGMGLYFYLEYPYVPPARTVLKVTMEAEKGKRKALNVPAGVQGVDSVAVGMNENKITVIGEADPGSVARSLTEFGFGHLDLLSVGHAKEEKNYVLKDLEELVNKDQKEKEKNSETPNVDYVYPPRVHAEYVNPNFVHPPHHDYNYFIPPSVHFEFVNRTPVHASHHGYKDKNPNGWNNLFDSPNFAADVTNFVGSSKIFSDENPNGTNPFRALNSFGSGHYFSDENPNGMNPFRALNFSGSGNYFSDENPNDWNNPFDASNFAADAPNSVGSSNYSSDENSNGTNPFRALNSFGSGNYFSDENLNDWNNPFDASNFAADAPNSVYSSNYSSDENSNGGKLIHALISSSYYFSDDNANNCTIL